MYDFMIYLYLFFTTVYCKVSLVSPISEQITKANEYFRFNIPYYTFRSSIGFSNLKMGIDESTLPKWMNFQINEIGEIGQILSDTIYHPCCHDIFVEDKYSFIAGKGSGFYILDISNVYNTTVLSISKPDKNIREYDGVEVFGKSAYLVDYSGYFDIWNISNFSSPALISSLPKLEQNLLSINVDGDGFAYVGGYDFRIYNVKRLSEPFLVSTTELTQKQYGNKIRVRGNIAFVASGAGLDIINIVHKTKPKIIGSYPKATCFSLFFDEKNESCLYLASNGEITYLSIIDLENPTEIWSIKTSHKFTIDIQIISGGDGYLVTSYGIDDKYMHGRIDVIDIHDLLYPEIAITFSFDLKLYRDTAGLGIRDNYVFSPFYNNGIRIFSLGGITLEGMAGEDCFDNKIRIFGKDDQSEVTASFSLKIVDCIYKCNNISSNNSSVCNSRGKCEKNKCFCYDENWSSESYCSNCSIGFFGSECKKKKGNDKKKNNNHNIQEWIWIVIPTASVIFVCCVCCCCFIFLLIILLGFVFGVLVISSGKEKFGPSIQGNSDDEKEVLAPELYF